MTAIVPARWLTRLFKVLERDSVDRKEADGGIVLRAHVGDGGSVRSRQLGDARSKELYKPPSNGRMS